MSDKTERIVHLYRLYAQAEKLEYRLLKLAAQPDADDHTRSLYERAYARRRRRRVAYDVAVYGQPQQEDSHE